MSNIIKEFTRKDIIDAVYFLDNHPEEFKGRGSSTYDLVYEGKFYPPILVLSKANQLNGGSELLLSDFNNSTERAFKNLVDLGFTIESKEKKKVIDTSRKVWIEKTITNNRADRLEGDRALGKALWSPQKDKRGAKIYENMLKVEEGDFVLHLIDNSYFSGISFVAKKAIMTEGIKGTDWEGDAYLIELKNYTKFSKQLNRDAILNSRNERKLLSIKNNGEVFYDSNLSLRQGAYLTPCSFELLNLINNEYFELTQENIPFINDYFVMNKNDYLALNLLKFQESLLNSNLQFNSNIVKRFIASLITKPFVILTGLSGSGKTKLAQSFIQWICESEDQYKIVPVGADWINREPSFGLSKWLKRRRICPPRQWCFAIDDNSWKRRKSR